MIVVDSSALLAIVLREPRGPHCQDALMADEQPLMSAGTLAETLIVAGPRNVSAAIETLIQENPIEVIPVTGESARRAAAAHARWGKGIHPARLNFGDCFAYELAESRGCSLLYIGIDFAQTDIASALADPTPSADSPSG